MEVAIHEAYVLLSGLDEDGRGGVAEEDARRAVGVVDDARHLLGADEYDLLL